jgi:hypothetical protein
MRRTVLGLLTALLAGACAHTTTETQPEITPAQAVAAQPTPAAKSEIQPEPALVVNRQASGRQMVRGGETLALAGADVKVVKVVYVNSPCPKGAECIHSGIIKMVQFKVARDGQEKDASVSEGKDEVVQGVELRVFSVSEGAQAEIQATVPEAKPKQ